MHIIVLNIYTFTFLHLFSCLFILLCSNIGVYIYIGVFWLAFGLVLHQLICVPVCYILGRPTAGGVCILAGALVSIQLCSVAVDMV